MDILIAFLFGFTSVGTGVLWWLWQNAERHVELRDRALVDAQWRIDQLERALWEDLPEPEFATDKDLGLDDEF